ncbi:uncharacterized protein [Elaeis guineensis]|uniref:Uncharacterized protein LOC109505092 isoform X1 n=1 Tax=Elaeis guineensis var. tenera TaxID=51953 RepID=A0A6J0PCR0_ELAGV|nr:uncharacterized protein LOC109505092 isoform X1 [Elaeis guineensis]
MDPTATSTIAAGSSNATPAAVAMPLLPTIPLIAHMGFPNTSKIEVFCGNNFKRWQECILSALDMYNVDFALTQAKPKEGTPDYASNIEIWKHANKVCGNTNLSTLSNDLFDVYYPYKEAKQIWESMNKKYTVEDVGQQRFVIGNYARWHMIEDEDIKMQIDKDIKTIDDLKPENIELPESFVAGMLIKKLPDSWSDYKQQLKHKRKMSLEDLIVHIIIEDRNIKQVEATRIKEVISKANLVQDKSNKHKRAPCTSVQEEGDMTILLSQMQIWFKQMTMTLLLWSFLK